ncbi:MAG: hypothetical protein KJ623_00145 [Nanoarchaeota archaeon]|nr:hypothetical protein [Nanoarchaeota archaeon]MBU0962284.1 hypothetical protein [Nanoarchaeota archaeon]
MESVVERHYELLNLAKKSLKTADHLTYMTYPLVKDIKIIVAITENIYSSVINAMESVLQYDRYYKRINPLAENFDSRFQVFKEKCAQRYNFDRDDLSLIDELRTIVAHRSNSTMEFIRNDKLIICSPNFKMKTFDINAIKQYLIKTKKFIAKVDAIVR